MSIIEEADITCRPEYKAFCSQKLSNFLDVFTRKKFTQVTTYYCDVKPLETYKVTTSASYHFWFFSSLCFRLNADGDYSWIPVAASSEGQVDLSEQRKRRYLGRYFAHPMMQNRRAKRDDYKPSAVRVTQRCVP
ncbi:hypothetical protein PsalN5692_03856 (plasmid) [Piscirickettsia salmonis]|uniref:hypothetical protein n=1 Tax=Piscirickettsia salmonis TaxID=1238 RepID=UPI0012BA19E5|nr:hypothetical protein [Piscirickettsia salmonis]QGP52347.1 hypothetical protein PsalN5692_03856 [Piscirickettsia salmonis]